MGNMIYIDGMDKLTAKIKKCQNLDPIKKVVKQNGSELQNKAQRNAPVDTGNLKRNMLRMSNGAHATWMLSHILNQHLMDRKTSSSTI